MTYAKGRVPDQRFGRRVALRPRAWWSWLIVLVGSLAWCAPASAVVGGSPVSDRALRRAVVEIGSCTGFYIGPNTVLTAAHCVWGHPRVELSEGTGRVVVDVAFSPAYVWARAAPTFQADRDERGDVAIVRFAPARRPISSGLRLYARPAATLSRTRDLLAIGTGQPSEREPTRAPKGEIAVHPVGDDACGATWARLATRYQQSWEPQSMLCTRAAKRHVGLCYGDSGGPVLAHTTRGWRVVGLHVWSGDPCASTPDVHTDLTVPATRTWITGPQHQWVPRAPLHALATLTVTGESVTCVPPTWERPPDTTRYEWSISGTDGSFVTDEPGYHPSTSDAGRRISCRALGMNAAGLGVTNSSPQLTLPAH